MGKLLVFCSGKGGVGKSTVAAAFAVAASSLGFKTLLLETDSGLRCLDLMLGVSDRLVFDLFDVLDAGRDFADAVISCDEADKLHLLSAPVSKYDLDRTKLVNLACRQTAHYDYVLMDCPAGIDKELLERLPSQAGILVVTNGTEVALRDAEGLRRTMTAKTDAPAFLILNRFKLRDIKRGRTSGIDDSMDKTGLRLAGVVPEDDMVTAMDSRRFAKSRVFKAMTRIVKRMEGEAIPLPKIKKI